MDTMNSGEADRDIGAESPVDTGAGQSPPWELIEAGRYQPRRIRGSCRGRHLG
jgi:hypothetical protein